MNEFLASIAGHAVRFVGGCILVLLGWFTLPSGSKPEPDPDYETQPPITEAPVSTPEARTYRLGYEQEEGFWMITPLGGDATALTDIIPGPRNLELPRNYLSPSELGNVLLEVLNEWQLDLSKQDRTDLLAIRLDHKPLFNATDLNNKTVSRPTKPAPVEIPVEKVEEPVAAAVEQPTNGPWMWQLPPQLNPTSPAFAQSMKRWRTRMLPMLKLVSRHQGSANVNVPQADGSKLRVNLSKSVRKTIARADFGNNRKDVALYLQYRALARGASITVDGAFGPGSRQAWRTILLGDGLQKQLVDDYIRFLEAYFGKAAPSVLNPKTETFREQMQKWAAWVRPRLDRNPVTWEPPFQGFPFKLTITTTARARLMASNFGKDKRDEAIYLQFLANFYGRNTTIDGKIGPATRKQLGEVMAREFRRPGSATAFRQQLQTRYP